MNSMKNNRSDFYLERVQIDASVNEDWDLVAMRPESNLEAARPSSIRLLPEYAHTANAAGYGILQDFFQWETSGGV